MSKNKLDFNGLETLITMIKDFVIKKINNEIIILKDYISDKIEIEDTNIKTYISGKISDEVTRSDNKYLPFSGGTMTGSLTLHNSGNALIWNSPSNIQALLNASNHECSIDLHPSNNTYTGTYFQVWSDKLSKPILQCYTDNCNVTIPNGNLTVGGKEVDRINSKGSNSNGDYIRYENGIQICWGGFANVSVPRTITYSLAFKSIPAVGLDRGNMMCGNWQTTGCNISMVAGGTANGQYLKWIAIGYWK